MIFKVLDKALAKSEDTSGLFMLNQAFRFGIPFNIPHGFRLTRLDLKECQVVIPKIKTNQNHLNTIHACAMATAGEFAAGVLLLKNYGASKVRLVLKNLNVDYVKQGTTKLTATASISDEKLLSFNTVMDANSKVFADMETVLKNKDGELVATVSTKWQIKLWSEVKTKF